MPYSTIATILGTAALSILKNKGSKANLNPVINLSYYKVNALAPKASFSDWQDNIIKEHVQKTIDQVVDNVSKYYPNLIIKSKLFRVSYGLIFVTIDITEKVSALAERSINSNAINVSDEDEEYFELWMYNPDSLTKSVVDASAAIETGIENALNVNWIRDEEFGASAEVILMSEKGQKYIPPKLTNSRLRKR